MDECGRYSEAWFHIFCPMCKYRDLKETEMNPKDPCWDCLHEPVAENYGSHRPVGFKDADDAKARAKEKLEELKAQIEAGNTNTEIAEGARLLEFWLKFGLYQN